MEKYFLGVDGGGTKTEFVLIDTMGNVISTYQTGTSYYVQIGFEALNQLLMQGIHAVLNSVSATSEDIAYAFFGLPAYGEDTHAIPLLNAAPAKVLHHQRYTCDNDMISGWAGSLGCRDGINIVAGTGSIGYGERAGISARSGGWSQVFSDEGSAYWIAISGLNAFSRMSDGRLEKGLLHDVIMQTLGLKRDLDLCCYVLGEKNLSRDSIAALAKLVSIAAEAGDPTARNIFNSAAYELAAIVNAIRKQLHYESHEKIAISYSGGVFSCGKLILEPFKRHLFHFSTMYDLHEPLYSPSIGSAIYAAKLLGTPLSLDALALLSSRAVNS
jgi:N-acetylglucosamine kinase-like BadF-type ATPase